MARSSSAKIAAFCSGRAAMAAADAGQHGGDMAIADLERLPELPVAPGDAGQAPLEGGDRKLRAAAFDLGSEVEADRFRVGRRFGKPLAAQPRGEHFPVRGVGALGVIGLGGAGVVLGGLRERRKAAAEASGGREQGRGVRAGSLGLERRAFRLSAIPGAFVKTALRVGWRASAGRAGPPRRRPRRPGVALGAATGPAGLPGPWRMRPPGLRCTAERGDAAQLRRGPRCSRAGELGRAEEGAPARSDSDPARSDASARSRDQRKGAAPGPMVQGLEVWPIAGLAKPGVEGRAAAQPSHACFRRLGGVKGRLRSGLRGARRGLRAWFCGVWHGVWAGFRIMSDNAILSDIPTPRQAGRIPRHTA